MCVRFFSVAVSSCSDAIVFFLFQSRRNPSPPLPINLLFCFTKTDRCFNLCKTGLPSMFRRRGIGKVDQVRREGLDKLSLVPENNKVERSVFKSSCQLDDQVRSGKSRSVASYFLLICRDGMTDKNDRGCQSRSRNERIDRMCLRRCFPMAGR